jgi:hypothetical protein
MDEEKRKKIEAEFQKLLMFENQAEEKKPSIKTIAKGVRVIRRRKGTPDLHIV